MDYETLYFTLAARVADAIEHLDANNYGLAQTTLVKAQLHCESLYYDIDS